MLIQKKKIYLVGDSTMANKRANRYPETGWGQVLAIYFNNEVEILNFAINGASTKSFIKNKNWERVLANLEEGDFVVIEFGHNDEKINNQNVFTSLNEYENNLIKLVSDVKGKKAIPILLSPVMRRSFKEGKFYNSHEGYSEIVKKVANEQSVLFIDMLQKSKNLLDSLGVENSKKLFLYLDDGNVNYPNGKKDNTHFNQYGATEMAKLFVQGIKELKSPLSNYLR